MVKSKLVDARSIGLSPKVMPAWKRRALGLHHNNKDDDVDGDVLPCVEDEIRLAPSQSLQDTAMAVYSNCIFRAHRYFATHVFLRGNTAGTRRKMISTGSPVDFRCRRHASSTAKGVLLGRESINDGLAACSIPAVVFFRRGGPISSCRSQTARADNIDPWSRRYSGSFRPAGHALFWLFDQLPPLISFCLHAPATGKCALHLLLLPKPRPLLLGGAGRPAAWR